LGGFRQLSDNLLEDERRFWRNFRMSSGTLSYIWNNNTIIDIEGIDEASLLELQMFRMIMLKLKVNLQKLIVDVP
jgi:hypothetical protein